MKKFLFLVLAAVAAAGLTSCLEKDDTFERLRPVMPGMEIVQKARLQNYYSMQPLNAAFRLALLAAEADGETDLSGVMYNNNRLIDLLYDGQTSVTRDGDDYRIVFRPGIVDAYGVTRNGSLVVKTGGRLQLRDTDAEHPWTVVLQDFEMQVVVGASSGVVQFTGGSFSLHAAGGGTYVLLAANAMAHFGKDDLSSVWNAEFTIKPAAASLKYADCAGKEFEAAGTGRGTSNFMFDGKTLMGLEYVLEEGRYKVVTTIEKGTERGRLLNENYDHTFFPSPKAEIVWSRDSNGSLHQQVTYNGVTATL